MIPRSGLGLDNFELINEEVYLKECDDGFEIKSYVPGI